MAGYPAIPSSYRRSPCYQFDGGHAVDFGFDVITRLIPHRPPFLLFDRIVHLDRQQRVVVAQRQLKADDFPFSGHFPNFPVYPGALQVELCGQVGLCLHYFLAQETDKPPTSEQMLNVRASKILEARYLSPLQPGDSVTVIARQWGDSDGFYAASLGQTLVGGRVACLCLQEVCFLDG